MRSLMAETPETPGRLDPDLDEPGEPIHATLELEEALRVSADPATGRELVERLQLGAARADLRRLDPTTSSTGSLGDGT